MQIPKLLRTALVLPDPIPTPIEIPPPILEPQPAPEPTVPEGPAYEPHALDLAPVNSKIVVVRDSGRTFALLATPDGVSELPEGDPAHLLFEGARIQKLGESLFRSQPVSSETAVDSPTAHEALSTFMRHFYQDG